MTTTQIPATANSKEVADWLTAEGFTFEGLHGEYDAWWFRRGSVRVVSEDEGYFAIYVFDAHYPKADVLAWEVKLSNAPFDMVARTIELARQMVAASLLPTD